MRRALADGPVARNPLGFVYSRPDDGIPRLLFSPYATSPSPPTRLGAKVCFRPIADISANGQNPLMWSDQEIVRLALEAVCLLLGAAVASFAARGKGVVLGTVLGFLAGSGLWLLMFLVQLRWFANWY